MLIVTVVVRYCGKGSDGHGYGDVLVVVGVMVNAEVVTTVV